jgi:hypothetical protein
MGEKLRYGLALAVCILIDLGRALEGLQKKQQNH